MIEAHVNGSKVDMSILSDIKLLELKLVNLG